MIVNDNRGGRKIDTRHVAFYERCGSVAAGTLLWHCYSADRERIGEIDDVTMKRIEADANYPLISMEAPLAFRPQKDIKIMEVGE